MPSAARLHLQCSRHFVLSHAPHKGSICSNYNAIQAPLEVLKPIQYIPNQYMLPMP